MGSVIPTETSRYAFAEEVELLDGTIVWTSPPVVEALNLTDDISHKVSEGETPFTLAMRFFRVLERPEQYYWVILDYQSPPIGDPLAPLEEGRILRIPSLRTLQGIILNSDRLETDPRMLIDSTQR